MIRNKTVLVLGAGASNPYGFPLGSRFSDMIRDGLHGEYEYLRVALHRVAISTNDIDKLAEQFRCSGSLSIDNWLARLPKTVDDLVPVNVGKFQELDRFRLVGKAMIAAVILYFEASSNLHPTRLGEDNWYSYLWHQMHYDCDWNELQNNQLSIITFNYDRSLESFLRRAAANLYHRDYNDVEAWMSTVPIVHVYGEVSGDYGWDLEMRLRPDNVSKSAHSIQVIPEGRNNTETLQRCHKILEEADRICYLGFGYDETNLERIDAANSGARAISPAGKPTRAGTVFGTALSMSEAERRKIARLCGVVSATGEPQKQRFYNLRCTELLRETLILGE